MRRACAPHPVTGGPLFSGPGRHPTMHGTHGENRGDRTALTTAVTPGDPPARDRPCHWGRGTGTGAGPDDL